MGLTADNYLADSCGAQWVALGAIRHSVPIRGTAFVFGIVYPAVRWCRVAYDGAAESIAIALMEVAQVLAVTIRSAVTD